MIEYTLEIYHLDLTINSFVKKAVLDQGNYQNLEFSNVKNGVGGCRFSMNIEDSKAIKDFFIRGKTHIAVKRVSDGDIRPVVVWFGTLDDITASYADYKGIVSFQFYSILYHLKSRYTASFKQYTQQEMADILWDLINTVQSRTNGNLLISRGSYPTIGVLKDRTYQYDSVADCLINMSQIIGGVDFTFDTVVNSDDDITGIRFNVYYPLGNIRKDLATLRIGENISKISFSTSRDIANSITVIGSGTGNNPSIAESAASQISFTRKEAIINDKSVIDQTTLDKNAEWELFQRTVESYIIDIELMQEMAPKYGYYNLGDQLKADFNLGIIDFNGYLEIIELSVSVDQNGKEIIKPVVNCLI